MMDWGQGLATDVSVAVWSRLGIVLRHCGRGHTLARLNKGSAHMDFDLFVIGGGSAGVRCARISAGHGARVGVAEERYWGGTCVNVGCVPKKLLVQAGEYGAWAEDAAGFGWQIKKGPHNWRKLIAAKDKEIG